jgi:hypothetical protein
MSPICAQLGAANVCNGLFGPSRADYPPDMATAQRPTHRLKNFTAERTKQYSLKIYNKWEIYTLFFLILCNIFSGSMVVAAPTPQPTGEPSSQPSREIVDNYEILSEVKLLAGDGAANDQFGSAVSTYSNIAVIGAPMDDEAKGIYKL